MENRIYYYARVSTKEQNLDRQLAAFKALGASERDIITDKESGKNLDRAGYQALKTTMLRAGDTLVVKSLDRLSRNKGDIRPTFWLKEVLGNTPNSAAKVEPRPSQMTPPDSSLSEGSRFMPPSITPEISPTVSTAVTINMTSTGRIARLPTPKKSLKQLEKENKKTLK